MKLTRLLLALGLVLGPTFAFQSDPDDPNPEWPGQKMACNNFYNTTHKCHCARATECRRPGDGKGPITDTDLGGDGDSEMGTRCRTFCRPSHCSCLACTS